MKVGDFGIAKAAESADLTQEGSFLGTAKYLAPEQVEAKPVDGRTDLYSLGVVLYEMLCGRVPFEADTSSSTALARLHSDPPRPRLVKAGVPRELEAITMRLLARDPDGRYPTATDARAALLSAGADDQPTAATPTITASGAPLAAAAPAGRRRDRPAPSAPRRRAGRRHRRRARRSGSPTPSAAGSSPRSSSSSSPWRSASPGCCCRASGDGIFGGDGGDDPPAETDRPPRPTPLTITALDRLRPRGDDGEEHPDEAEAGNAFDGDPSTSWSSESYTLARVGRPQARRRPHPRARPGRRRPHGRVRLPAVGVAGRGLRGRHRRRTRSTAGASPWARSRPSDGTAPTRVEVDAEGGAVLVWFTRASDSSGSSYVQVDEVRVFG